MKSQMSFTDYNQIERFLQDAQDISFDTHSKAGKLMENKIKKVQEDCNLIYKKINFDLATKDKINQVKKECYEKYKKDSK